MKQYHYTILASNGFKISVSDLAGQDLWWKNQWNIVIGSPLHPPKHHHLIHIDSEHEGVWIPHRQPKGVGLVDTFAGT